jgi:Flp pilus assembly protein TadG
MRIGLRIPIIISVRAPAARDERGAAVVEFALVLPLLVMFIFGIIEFGRAYSAKVELTAAVREGARAAALGSDGAVATRTATDLKGIKVDAIPACPAKPASTDRVTVSAHHNFTYEIPLFGRGTWTLSAKGVMRCGG